jgi:hypothetical protein
VRNTDDLRHALAAETAHLTVHIPIQTVRRRARGIRVRRSATVAVAGTVAALAVAAPIVLLRGGPSTYNVPQPPAAPPTCPTTPPASPRVPETLGPLAETGSVLDAAGAVSYDVLIGLEGTRDEPVFVIAFRDRNTGEVEVWQMVGLLRGRGGDLPSKTGGAPYYQFLSDQLTLGPRRVLDVGLYTRTAHRITVASEGRESDADTALNAPTGWTLFWVERSAAPVPSSYSGQQRAEPARPPAGRRGVTEPDPVLREPRYRPIASRRRRRGRGSDAQPNSAQHRHAPRSAGRGMGAHGMTEQRGGEATYAGHDVSHRGAMRARVR